MAQSRKWSDTYIRGRWEFRVEVVWRVIEKKDMTVDSLTHRFGYWDFNHIIINKKNNELFPHS